MILTYGCSLSTQELRLRYFPCQRGTSITHSPAVIIIIIVIVVVVVVDR